MIYINTKLPQDLRPLNNDAALNLVYLHLILFQSTEDLVRFVITNYDSTSYKTNEVALVQRNTFRSHVVRDFQITNRCSAI
jgi:hypothetical protein